ncbi:MAG TPA: putative ABC transporter permease [Bacillota bacterium]|nr:putative ABC transporter permease [Bacillota bacterium]
MSVFSVVKDYNSNPIKLSKPKSVYYLILLFMVSCLIGWIYEEIFYYFTESFVGNRGFLYGPYLPVYGFGALCMLLLLKPLKKHPILFFFSAMVLTGVLEYITGWVLHAIWGRDWWTYDGLFMNIGGYVCLRSVITFGIGGLMLIYLMDPVMTHMVDRSSKRVLHVVSVALIAVLCVDLIVTLLIRY